MITLLFCTAPNLYTIAWETDSNPSVLDNPNFQCDPTTLENTISWDSVSQPNAASPFPEGNDSASSSFFDEQLCNSRRSDVKALKIDMHVQTDASNDFMTRQTNVTIQTLDIIQIQLHLLS